MPRKRWYKASTDFLSRIYYISQVRNLYKYCYLNSVAIENILLATNDFISLSVDPQLQCVCGCLWVPDNLWTGDLASPPV